MEVILSCKKCKFYECLPMCSTNVCDTKSTILCILVKDLSLIGVKLQ